jgi:hypothetical protein
MASSETKSRVKTASPTPKKNVPVIDTVLISEKYQDLAALGFLLLLLLVFYSPVLFGGKIFLVPDNTASLSTQTFLDDAAAAGIEPLWIPYVFSGMPSLGSLFSGGPRSFDFITHVWWSYFVAFFSLPASNKEAAWIVLYYFFFGAGIYALLRVKGATAFQSLIASIGAVFATLAVVWITVGHNTKMLAVSMIPFALALAERLRKAENWKAIILNTALLTLVLSTMLRSTHVQMIYYGVMFVCIYFLVEFIYGLLKKERLTPFFTSVGGMAVAALLALSMSADTYLTVLEYSPYSIRGASSVTSTYPELAATSTEPKSKAGAKDGGLDYDYATGWSFGTGEVMTFFAPSYYGYGNSTYWGPQAFTMCPQFFGTVILALALIGTVYYRRDRFVQAMVIAGLFALVISFGRNFSLIFDILFNTLPFFNKFRAPSMILILSAISSCVLAGYGLKAIYELRSNAVPAAQKFFQYVTYGAGALFIGGLLGLSGCKQSYLESIAESDKVKMLAAQNNVSTVQVAQYFDTQLKVFDMMKSDFILSLVLVAILLAVSYLFITRTLNKIAFQSVLILIVVVDFYRADAQLLQGAQPKVEQQTLFEKPDFVEFLQKDKTSFRILPLLRDKEPNWYAYYRLETVGGYQGAKLRLYQDLIELYGNGNTDMPAFFTNSVMMDLLNIKYILADQAAALEGFKPVFTGSKTVLEREAAAPRAWLVQTVEKKTVPEILKAIQAQSFNPRTTAFVETDIAKMDVPDSSTAVQITNYGIHEIDLKVTASGNHFLFLSEMYYPAGWKCTIDGAETAIQKTNYAFRGVVVPKGTHDIKFSFAPRAYPIGKSFSIGANILVLFALVFSSYEAIRRKLSKPEAK